MNSHYHIWLMEILYYWKMHQKLSNQIMGLRHKTAWATCQDISASFFHIETISLVIFYVSLLFLKLFLCFHLPICFIYRFPHAPQWFNLIIWRWKFKTGKVKFFGSKCLGIKFIQFNTNSYLFPCYVHLWEVWSCC